MRKLSVEIEKLANIPFDSKEGFYSFSEELWGHTGWGYELVMIDDRMCLNLEKQDLSIETIKLITNQFYEILGPDWHGEDLSNFLRAVENNEEEGRAFCWIGDDRFFGNLPFGAFMEPEHASSLTISEDYGRFTLLIEPIKQFIEFINELKALNNLQSRMKGGYIS